MADGTANSEAAKEAAGTAAVAAEGRWRSGLRIASRLLCGVLASIGLAYLVVTLSASPVVWLTEVLRGPWHEDQGEILIVLGADEPSAGFIGLGSYWRGFYAVQAWKQGGWRKILVCGGNETAGSIRELLLLNGVPSEAVMVENQSTNTYENAQLAGRLLQGMEGRKVVLTADYHARRAEMVFRKQGMEVGLLTVPYGVKRAGRWQDRWSVFIDLCEEAVKLAGYRWRGWA